MKYKMMRASLLVRIVLLLAVCIGLSGCGRGEIPTTLPVSSIEAPPPSPSSEPESSSSQEESSEPESSSSKKSSTAPGTSTGSAGTSDSGKVYSSAVTSSKKETLRTVKITASGVSLSNKTITGDLVIDKGVGDGNVTLQNVTVGGTIYVYGGGENSIYLDSVTAKRLVSASTVSRPRIIAGGDTVIGETQVRYDTLLEHAKLSATASGFTSIQTVKTSQLLTVLKLYNISMNTITLDYETNLYLLGSSSIGSIIANKPSYIEGGDKVGLLFCYSKNVRIDTAPAHIASDSKTYEPKIRDAEDEDDTDTRRPQLSAPKITRNGNEIRWSAVSGASNGYEVRVNLKGSTVYLYKTLSSGTRTIDIAKLLDDNEAPNGDYQIRVLARSTSSRDESDYSNTISVTCTGSTHAPLSLTSLTFDGTGDISKYTASWTAAGATKGYNVTVATNSSFSNRKLNTNITSAGTKSIDLRAAMGSSFVPIVLNAPYHIRITAKSAFEQVSVVGQFTVTKAPMPTGLTYNDATKKLTWLPSGSAIKYLVSVNGAPATEVTGAEFDMTAFPTDTDYTVRVTAVGWAGNVLNSDAEQFVVNKSGTPTPALTAPTTVTLTQDQNDNRKLNLTWTAPVIPSSGITYNVVLKKDGEEIAGLAASGINGTSHTFTLEYAADRTGNYTATVIAKASGYTDSAAGVSGTVAVTANNLLFKQGTGEIDSKYLVSNAEEFKNIASVTGGIHYFEQTASFTVDADHRVTGTFAGSYDGNGQTITVSISATEASNVGLFETIGTDATLKNITVSASSSVVGATNVGMIAGVNYGTIDACIIQKAEEHTPTVTGTSYVGGIAGINAGTGIIKNCTYSGALKETGYTEVLNVKKENFGLICGFNETGGDIDTGNNIEGAPYKSIGMTGNPEEAPGGEGEGVDGMSLLMLSRLAGWLSL